MLIYENVEISNNVKNIFNIYINKNLIEFKKDEFKKELEKIYGNNISNINVINDKGQTNIKLYINSMLYSCKMILDDNDKIIRID